MFRKMTIKQRLSIIILTILTPLLKWIGNIYTPYSIKSVIKEYYNFIDLLEPLDIILTYTKGYAANFLIPSKQFKHAVIYIGKENYIPMVVEADEIGVIKRPLIDLLSEIDRIAIMRGKENPINYKEAYNFIDNNIGKPYDYLFDDYSKNKFKAFFCSEFVVDILSIIYPSIVFKKSQTYLLESTTPDDIYKSNDMKIIYEIL
jgi:uncharacterized protein YycO